MLTDLSWRLLIGRATAAHDEFAGEGGAWAARTAQQLKDREHTLKQVLAKSTKANKAEAEGDAAVAAAQKRLDDGKADHAEKADAAVKAEEVVGSHGT